MNEKKLIQFVQWLPTKIKELEEAKPEQIVKLINKMGETKEGLSQLENLFQQFEKESKTISMKNGGKFEYIKMLKNGGCPSCNRQKIEKAENGTPISNREAKKTAIENNISRKQYRQDRNQYNKSIKNNDPDMSRKDRIALARKNAAGIYPQLPVLNTNVIVEDFPIGNDTSFSRLDSSIAPIELMKVPPKELSFNEAFAAARKNGDKIFEWRGNKYGTKLKEELNPFEQVQQTYGQHYLFNPPPIDYVRQPTNYVERSISISKSGGVLDHVLHNSNNTILNKFKRK